MVKNILCHALYQLLILFTIFYYAVPSNTEPTKYFIQRHPFENCLQFQPKDSDFSSEMTSPHRNSIVIRLFSRPVWYLAGLASNRVFCVIWVSTFIAQILIIQFGSAWFSTAPLTLNQVPPSKIHINGDYNVRARSRALTIRRTGKSLWMRGMFLMGQHLRTIRAFQMRDRNIGKTAPTMTAEAAERWRSSYRKYRHQKHQEK
ncbi:hypothetical protein TELCIR_20712, partial [Teladorsagia circumcincta]